MGLPSPELSDIDARQVISGWWSRPASLPAQPRSNAITIDVEDYFQVEAFSDVIDRHSWDTFECRVERNVDLILDLLRRTNSRATFFTLAWVAKGYPKLLNRIIAEGHELASHGWDHCRADKQNPKEFFEDVSRAKQLLEDVGGVEVKGYRAPSFSVLKKNLWVFEVLAEAGYHYSSSTYPISHDNYGIPEAPPFAFHPLPDHQLVEIPVTSIRLLGRNWPCGGGGYFRLLPYFLSAAALKQASSVAPCVFYLHPWEVDPAQPRVRGARLKSRFRHYLNLNKVEPRLERLLSGFTWDRMDRIFVASERVVP